MTRHSISAYHLAITVLLVFLQVTPSFGKTLDAKCLASHIYDFGVEVAEIPASGLVTRTLEQQRAEWAGIEPSNYWQDWIDNETDFLRFIRKGPYIQESRHLHGSEIYGLENFLAWKKSDDYLNSIALGKLELSLDLFKETHRQSSDGLFRVLKKLSPVIPDGFLPSKAGVLKKRYSFGRDPLFYPLGEKEYEVLKQNRWIDKFVELPGGLSEPGKRRGIILYGAPQDTERKLKELISWYNSNKDTMDPVELAAEFQQAFVSIHPFIDGNGRASRLLMDRILAEHGLPPPLLNNSSMDLYYTPKEWAEKVRVGIDDYLNLHAKLRQSGKISNSGELMSVKGREVTRLALAKLKKTTNREGKVLHDFSQKELTLGNRRFRMFNDGFFYSNKGIPYTYREGKLYPVADRTYLLYGENGKFKNGIRSMSDSQKQLYRDHFQLLRDLDSEKIKQEAIEVGTYDVIDQANRKGEVFLYPWQKEVFRNAVTIDATDPAEVLFRSRNPQTNFERRFPTTDPMSPSDVVGQYLKVDYLFWEDLQAAREYVPDLVPTVMESREKLHGAARELLKPYFESREALSPEAKAQLSKSGSHQLLEDYLHRTKLRYESFEEAMEKTDDSAEVLLRADHVTPKYIGFRSQEQYKQMLQSLPGAKKISAFARELDARYSKPEELKKLKQRIHEVVEGLQKNHPKMYDFLPGKLKTMAKDLDKEVENFRSVLALFIRNILSHRYASRGSSAEFERLTIDYILHMTGYSPVKPGVSFTSSPALLMPRSENIAFTKKGFDNRVFLVSVPKNKMHWNWISQFQAEYEFVADKTIGPHRVLGDYTLTQLTTVDPFLTEFFKTKKNVPGTATAPVAPDATATASLPAPPSLPKDPDKEKASQELSDFFSKFNLPFWTGE